jgi:hypothetical protein
MLAGAAAGLSTLVWIAVTHAAPPQYRLILQESVAKGWPVAWSTALLLLGALCCCALLWRHRLLSRWTALAAVSPVIAMLASCWILTGFSLSLLTGMLIAIAIPVAVLLLGKAPRSLPAPPGGWLVDAVAVGAIALVFLGFAIFSAVCPIEMPRKAGSLTIVSVFLSCAGVLACGAVLRPRFGAVAVVWWLFAGIFLAPNDHAVTTRPAAGESRGVEQALREWLANRRDLDTYRKARMPYPVIFVSSEGGGIYAAAHAHAVLSTLAARCPTFGQHVLVTVGVSGGAVGNALFHGSADPVQKAAAPCSPGDTKLNQAALTADHLSPVLARFLLLETIDTLLPGRWIGRDRGGALVDSFLASAADPSRLDVAVGQSFDPGSALPAVAAVATDMGTGGRLILSPIIAESSTAAWAPLSATPGTRDIGILEAAGISARFPWVTPTARLKLSDEQSLVLADGGYFENSGADTVLDFIRELRVVEAQEIADEKAGNDTGNPVCRLYVARDINKLVTWEGCAIHIFPIHLAITTTMLQNEDGTEPIQVSQSFLLDPLSTLIASRSSRGLLALKRAEAEQCGGAGECVEQPEASSGFFTSYLSPKELQLPLGWFIRDAEVTTIAEAGVPREIFAYRDRPEPVEGQLAEFILHFDPALWKREASPGIDDYRGQP